VHAEDPFDAEAFHHAILHHFIGSATAFLGGLENHRNGPTKVPRFAEMARCPQ
jgi:hypothetical protein